MQELIAQEVGTRVDDPPGSAPIRSQFVASQVVGLVVAHYILEWDPPLTRHHANSYLLIYSRLEKVRPAATTCAGEKVGPP
jgi:hypothetical protein